MSIASEWMPVEADGHRWDALVVAPPRPRRVALWVPALGVPARHYEPFAQALAARGAAVVVHEWRGFGSSSARASRGLDWGYRELLGTDLPATRRALEARFGDRAYALGGHSLGGQLASCSAALDSRGVEALWLVASGAPYHRAFPAPTRYWLPLAYRSLAGLAQAFGALPGRRIGFGGQEARGVIRDWSRTALTGRYAAPGVGDLEERLRDVNAPVRGVLFPEDWLAPRSSLDYLVGKMRPRAVDLHVLDRQRLGTRADHFQWMRAPDPVAAALLD